nr:MAG TPA: hypothetical protein [Caudoviricetes sp.]
MAFRFLTDSLCGSGLSGCVTRNVIPRHKS